MGSCSSNPQIIYIVEENRKIILCTYDINKAKQLFEEPIIKYRELLEYRLDTYNPTPICNIHTYPYL